MLGFQSTQLLSGRSPRETRFQADSIFVWKVRFWRGALSPVRLPEPSVVSRSRPGHFAVRGPPKEVVTRMSPMSLGFRNRPTIARYKLLVFLGALTFILYLDRVSIGQAAPSIQAELNISDGAIGWVFGAFTLAYGLFEVVTGAWGDRYGSRRVLTRIVLWWSAFTVLTGCVPAFSWRIESWLGLEGFWPSRGWVVAFNSFAVLMVVRFLFGAGEAGALPNTARVVSRWFPLAERGLAQGTVLTCMLAGAAASYPLAGTIIGHYGWRWTFVLFGGLGVLWAGAFYWWFRDDPAEHSGVNAAELEWITSGIPAQSGNGGHPPIPWSFVLSESNVWLLGGIISCAAFTAYFYAFFFPTYLQNGRGMAASGSGWYAGMVTLGGACGAFFGSMLAGWADRSQLNPRWKRSLMGCGLMGTSAIVLSLSVACDTPIGASLCVMLAYGLAQAQQATWWSVVADISGKHLGAMFGLMNSMGVPGAVLSTVFTGRFVGQNKARGLLGRDAWDPIFIYFVGVLAVGALLWLFVDVTRSAVEPDEATAEGLLAGKLVPEPAPAA